VTDTKTDNDATAGASSFSQTINTGVQAGNNYECSIKIEFESGDRSAKSEPAVFRTPATGNIALWLILD